MARRMVTQFGMSDVIGLVAIGDAEHEVFLGRELVQRRQVSEHTARLVDQEVKRILDKAHDRARQVLEENRDLLERIAAALLERETLDRAQIQTLERGDPLPPLPGPGAPCGRRMPRRRVRLRRTGGAWRFRGATGRCRGPARATRRAGDRGVARGVMAGEWTRAVRDGGPSLWIARW